MRRTSGKEEHRGRGWGQMSGTVSSNAASGCTGALQFIFQAVGDLRVFKRAGGCEWEGSI